MKIEFTIPGEVRGKGRPRATKMGANVRLYTDDKTAAYENKVAMFGSQAMAGRPPIDGPVRLTLVAIVPIPPSWPKKKQADALAGRVWPTGKPDLDNCLKAICDGLNGVCFADDKQIVRSDQEKRYGPEARAYIAVAAL